METVTELLIDLSGSMKEKFLLTKKILLEEVVPNLDYSTILGIKTFAKIDRSPPTKQILELKIAKKEEIVSCIYKLGIPEGGAPIGEAIIASVKTLKQYAIKNKKIILITDGNEDAGGNYVVDAKKVFSDGTKCEVHIIGIGLNDREKARAIEISNLTNGTYSHIPYTQNYYYDAANLRAHLSPFFVGINASPLFQNNSNVLVANDNLKKSTEFIGKKLRIIKKIEDIKETISLSTNEALSLIVSEIKTIKKQLNELQLNYGLKVESYEDCALDEKVRYEAEKYLYKNILQVKYPSRVNWLNEFEENNAEHDFEILDLDGSVEYFIICKGSLNDKPTFSLSIDEWKLFLRHTKNYQIYFVKNTLNDPSYIFIDNLLDWILKGKVLPCIKQSVTIKLERVFLSIIE